MLLPRADGEAVGNAAKLARSLCESDRVQPARTIRADNQ